MCNVCVFVRYSVRRGRRWNHFRFVAGSLLDRHQVNSPGSQLTCGENDQFTGVQCENVTQLSFKAEDLNLLVLFNEILDVKLLMQHWRDSDVFNDWTDFYFENQSTVIYDSSFFWIIIWMSRLSRVTLCSYSGSFQLLFWQDCLCVRFQLLFWREGSGAAAAGFVRWVHPDVGSEDRGRRSAHRPAGWSPAHLRRGGGAGEEQHLDLD